MWGGEVVFGEGFDVGELADLIGLGRCEGCDPDSGVWGEIEGRDFGQVGELFDLSLCGKEVVVWLAGFGFGTDDVFLFVLGWLGGVGCV